MVWAWRLAGGTGVAGVGAIFLKFSLVRLFLVVGEGSGCLFWSVSLSLFPNSGLENATARVSFFSAYYSLAWSALLLSQSFHWSFS